MLAFVVYCFGSRAVVLSKQTHHLFHEFGSRAIVFPQKSNHLVHEEELLQNTTYERHTEIFNGTVAVCSCWAFGQIKTNQAK